MLNPPGEQEGLGFACAGAGRRLPGEAAGFRSSSLTLGIAIAGLPLLYYLRFDFNPMNLRSPKVELIATYLDLRRDPTLGANAINVLAPSR